mmetsp:Transcript_37641/g.70631  ORF Transcript_37641/g.70631 Transcript_37641/m.70631 type:complete len:314 (+) Transcript_37641:1530-2471(+)
MAGRARGGGAHLAASHHGPAGAGPQDVRVQLPAGPGAPVQGGGAARKGPAGGGGGEVLDHHRGSASQDRGERQAPGQADGRRQRDQLPAAGEHEARAAAQDQDAGAGGAGGGGGQGAGGGAGGGAAPGQPVGARAGGGARAGEAQAGAGGGVSQQEDRLPGQQRRPRPPEADSRGDAEPASGCESRTCKAQRGTGEAAGAVRRKRRAARVHLGRGRQHEAERVHGEGGPAGARVAGDGGAQAPPRTCRCGLRQERCKLSTSEEDYAPCYGGCIRRHEADEWCYVSLYASRLAAGLGCLAIFGFNNDKLDLCYP